MPPPWVIISLMNVLAVLTRLQTANGTRFPKESERVRPNEEAYTHQRVFQQDVREEISPMKGKARNGLTENSTARWSQPPAPEATGPSYSRFGNDTANDDAAKARALQAQLDSEWASYDLARQLQAEDEATLREHQLLMQEAARSKSFDCVVCMEKYPEDYSAPVRSCGHVLCRNCMKDHVQAQVDQAVWPVLCPLCVADRSRTQGHGGEYGRVPRLKAY